MRRLIPAVLAALTLAFSFPAVGQIDPAARGLAVQAKAAAGTPIQQTARRLLAYAATPRTQAALSGFTWTNTSSGYSGTGSVASGASWNNPTVKAGDLTKMAVTSGVLSAPDSNFFVREQSVYHAGSYNARLSGGQGWSVSFFYDCQTFDISVLGDAGNSNVRLRVDGLYTATTNSPNGHRYLKADLGSAVVHRIDVLFNDSTVFNGFNLPSTGCRMWPAPSTAPRAVWYDASFGYGGELPDPRTAFPFRVADALGLEHIQNRSQSGQGWVNPADGLTLADDVRIASIGYDGSGTPAQPSLIGTGINGNDANVASATLAAAFKAGLQKMLATYPNALVVAHCGIRQTGTADVGTARIAAACAAANSIGSPRLLVIDSTDWIVLTNEAGANQSSYLGGNNHPTIAGANYLGFRADGPLVAWLRALAGY